MPDFIAGLIAAAIFCLGLTALNLLTRMVQALALLDIAEGGLVQYGGAILLAYAVWKRSVQNQAGVVKE